MKVEGTNRRYQFFITDHLGSTRAIVERVGATTTLVQENHYGVWGETLAGLSSTADWNFLFQGKEYIDFEGYNVYDFHTRGYDPWTGRFWQVDGANQFASGYIGMGNIPTIGVDPDGQWLHIVVGAVVGGVVNLGVKAFQGKIGSWGDGFAAFGIGAAAGAVTAATGGAAAVYATTGSFGAAFSAGAVGAATTGVVGGAVAGGAGAATGGLVQGVGNAAYFGDPYSGKDWAKGLGIGALTGGIGGGVAAGVQGKNIWTGAQRANGAGPFSFNNAKLLNDQGWTRVKGNKFQRIYGDGLIFDGADLGDGVLRDFAGRRIGETVNGNLPTAYYPPNSGALGGIERTFLRPGEIIDRFGTNTGKYFSPANTPMGARSLPYNANISLYNKYEVLKPFEVEASRIAPAFGKIGGGIQYRSAVSVDVLLKRGIIRPVR